MQNKIDDSKIQKRHTSSWVVALHLSRLEQETREQREYSMDKHYTLIRIALLDAVRDGWRLRARYLSSGKGYNLCLGFPPAMASPAE